MIPVTELAALIYAVHCRSHMKPGEAIAHAQKFIDCLAPSKVERTAPLTKGHPGTYTPDEPAWQNTADGVPDAAPSTQDNKPSTQTPTKSKKDK
jgi:hypothetical protein